MDPTVGIPLCLDAANRIRAGREYLYSDVAYARAVERAGGIPLHLPIQAQASALIDRIDALLLPGGDDFLPDDLEVMSPGHRDHAGAPTCDDRAAQPASYPEDVHFTPTDSRQLEFDRALLTLALERELPVLGICYGAQLIVLHHGGSLHHHLPIDVPEASDHQLPESHGRHRIQIEPKSRLASLIGVETVSVNSLHHQGIASTGRGLEVAARADDRIIEAVEARSDGFCMGVQWHPEKLACATSDSLFRGFVRAARARATG